MKAIEIIGRLRERYSNKYTQTPNKNKDHYINWLQDEYAELVMKQANEADTGGDKCHIQNVMAIVCPNCGSRDVLYAPDYNPKPLCLDCTHIWAYEP